MEVLTKLVISALVVIAIYYEALFLVKVWRSQIDPGATISRLIGKLKPETELIATRDPGKLYSEGKVVAVVAGRVIEEDKKVTFELLLDSPELKIDQVIEYRRMRLKVVKLGDYSGTFRVTVVSESGPRTVSGNNARHNVICESLAN